MTSDRTACLTGIVLSDTSTAADLPSRYIFWQKSLLKWKHQKFSPRMIFEKSVVPFRSYLQNVLTTVIAARDKAQKPNTFLWGGGGGGGSSD